MRRWFSRDIGIGTDQTIMSWPIPADCKIGQVTGTVHVAAAAAQPVANAHAIACQGWILQSETPADYQNMDTIWDKFVPKDDNPGSIDNSVGADTDSVFEPGLTNMNQVFEQEIGGPKRVYKQDEILTIANMRQAGFVDSAQTFIPSHIFAINLPGRYRVSDDSGLVFALASPDVTQLQIPNNDVVVSVLGNSRDSFFTLAHLEDFVHLAMINLTNMTEAGAQEPYENLFDFIEQSIEQVNQTGSVSTWASTTWNSWGKAMAVLTTMSRMNIQSLGPDAQAQ